MRNLVTLLAAGLVLTSCEPPSPGDTAEAGPSLQTAPFAANSCSTTPSDQVPPQLTITSPSSGSTQSGTVTVTVDATDNVEVAWVSFYHHGRFVSSDNTPPFELVWDSTAHGNGPAELTVEATDTACNSTSAAVNVTFQNAGIATYDASWGAPACATVGSTCDSADLLEGRAGFGELNAPNHLGGACSDGTFAVGYPVAAMARLVVSRSDGTVLAPGKEVTIEATVQATASYASQALDLYVAADPGNPTWTHVDTLFPPNAVGRWTLSSRYLVPAGGRHVVRGIFRGNGRQTPPSACIVTTQSNTNDHDDLVITVGQERDATPPVVAITSPTEGATLERVIDVAAEASDNFGVSRVELYDGATLVTSDSRAPYVLSWATRTVPNGPHTITVRAYDQAGNVTTSAPVHVLLDNDYVAPQVAFLSPVEGATVNGLVPLQASASDDRAVARVDFHVDGVSKGSVSVPPYTYSWSSRGVSNGPHVLRATAYDPGGNPSPPSTVNVLVDNDYTVPYITAITSPADGASVSGTVQIEAVASDDRGIAAVEFYVSTPDGSYSIWEADTTAPYSFTWDTTKLAGGSYTVSALAKDQAGNGNLSQSVTLNVSNPGNARFDPDLKVPRCDSVAERCDTLGLLTGRGDWVGPELNRPNTLNGSCGDGGGWRYGAVEAIDRLQVFREDGTALATGKRVRIEAAVRVYSALSNALDLYYTANANASPVWTYLTTVQPTAPGAGTLSAEYVLPAGGLQAVRAVFRYQGSPAPCIWSDPYVDHDDLVFPVGPAELTDTVPPDGVVLTAPVPGTTVTGTVTLTASTSDNVGVAAVDYFDGQTLIGTAAQAPYSVSWNTRNGANGPRTLTARARDVAGNEVTSQPVTVTADNDFTAPVVAITSPVADARVAGSVQLTADATDDRGAVKRVEFYVDGVLRSTDTTAPFTASWSVNVTQATQYTLTAKAYDAVGNVAGSAPVVVTAVRELTPPSVSFNGIGQGWALSGTVTLSAMATDTSGVGTVEFLLEGERLALVAFSPYSSPYFSYVWNTQTVANGTYTLSARARDFYGNVATVTARITVDNEAPAVALTSPANGALVEGVVSLQADATDNAGVTRVEFLVDGVVIASDLTAPYAVDWDSGLWPNGSHTVLARAYDVANHVTSSASVSVSTNHPGAAVYDPVLRVPSCSTPAHLCDTLDLVKGRHTGEPNGPGTLNATCADGTSSLSAQKIDRLRVVSLDGADFSQGQRVRLEVTVNAIDTATDALDLFHASDATSPSWTYLTTLKPGATGSQVLSAEYVLPVGRLQAVRAQFRVGGSSGSACSTGSRDDHDDVVFRVKSSPTVALTAPSHNAWVRGGVSLTATATDDQGVERVEFYVDGTLLGTGTSAPYALSWDSTAMTDGAHTLTARAYDTEGLTSTSPAVVVNVDNTLPDVALLSPTQGAFVRSSVLLEASASDGGGVAKVEFYDGTTLIGTTVTAPYVMSWSTTSVASGAHSLTVKAFDSAGNVRTSAAVGVSIDNTAPTVSLSAPTYNARVGGNAVQLSATASDAVGVARVEFYVGGTLIGTDTSAPYSVSWDASSLADGVQWIVVSAHDRAGNFRNSASSPVTIDNTAPDTALLSPTQGSYVRAGYIPLEASASDSNGGSVARVEFYDGTTLIGSDTSAPHAVTWDTISGVEGAHTLTVKAYDSVGNVRTSAGVSVTLDRTAPVTAVSAPAQNALVRGPVPVSATASDTSGVDRVEFYADGTLVGTATTAPYVVSWDSTTAVNGFVNLTTKAYDVAGNVTSSAYRTVTVDNAAPTAAITSPANGTSFSFLTFSTTIQASASDNRGVAQVVFYDGATVLGTDTTAPYSFSWNLTSAAKGTHTLTVKAHDAAGNVTTSAPISVKVN